MTDLTEWPSGRGSKANLVTQFGESSVSFLGDMLTTGDPLADAVVSAIKADNSIRGQLNRGLKNGLASIENPHPAITGLLQSTEAIPAFVNQNLMESGARSWYSVPFPLHIISLSAGALVKVYASTSIARVLATTGRLVEGADRRVQETGLWLASAMLPGGLKLGQPGYIGTVQVRMLHAMMRPYVRTHGYDESVDGYAISQVDLARTWLDFTLTSMRSEAIMGGEYTTAEIAEIYQYWWHIGYLLGIDPRFYEGVKSHNAAQRISDMLDAVTGLPISETSSLVKSTLSAISAELKTQFPVPNKLSSAVLETLARMFHGDSLSDDLLLGNHPEIKMLLNPLFNAKRAKRSSLRKNQEEWEAKIDKNIEDSKVQIESGRKQGSAYEAESKGELHNH